MQQKIPNKTISLKELQLTFMQALSEVKAYLNIHVLPDEVFEDDSMFWLGVHTWCASILYQRYMIKSPSNHTESSVSYSTFGDLRRTARQLVLHHSNWSIKMVKDQGIEYGS